MKVKLLVPTDFSDVAHSAIQHAVKFSSIINAELILLHVVESREGIESAKEKLSKDEIIGKSYSSSCTINSYVRIGNIFEDIGDFAAEFGVSLIFMGTHKYSRWQKIVGSRAIRVITSSPVPFILVQEKLMDAKGYDNIVVPLDLHKETKQKLTIVANIAIAKINFFILFMFKIYDSVLFTSFFLVQLDFVVDSFVGLGQQEPFLDISLCSVAAFLASIAFSGIPHLVQSPGLSLFIAACIGQV